jgi:hypothetical protein
MSVILPDAGARQLADYAIVGETCVVWSVT